MTGSVDDEGRRTAKGASRREVLRGGAVGMGVLAGAMALINASAASSEAKDVTGRTLTIGFAGINLNHAVPLHSFTVGGDFTGSPTSTPATLTLDTNAYSPMLLRAYAEALNLSKIVIESVEPNAAGVAKLVETITIGGVRITSYHVDVVTDQPARVRDNLQVAFTGLTIFRHDLNTTYTWLQVA